MVTFLFPLQLDSRSQMDWLAGWRWKDWGFSCRSGRGLAAGEEWWLQLSRADFWKPSAHSSQLTALLRRRSLPHNQGPALLCCSWLEIILILTLLWIGAKFLGYFRAVWLLFGRWSPVRWLRKRQRGSESGRIARGRAAAQHVSSYLRLSMWGLDTQARAHGNVYLLLKESNRCDWFDVITIFC